MASDVSSAASLTVLVVDDDPSIRTIMQTFLNHHGYQALLAASGEQALQLAGDHAGPIDLLITDMLMPGMGGHELARHLLAQQPQMCVIYISGTTDEKPLEPARSVYLAKPFAMAELLQAIQSLLA